MPKQEPFAWTRCKGRNGWDNPLDVPTDMATEVLNMHFYEGSLGTKRAGSSNRTPTGVAFAGINALARFVPGQDETVAELFLVTNDQQVLRVAGGTTATAMTVTDAPPASFTDVSTATLNGKLYVAYDSSVNRLHVVDPSISATTIRRAGLAPPGGTAFPGVSDTGSGAYAAVARQYKAAFAVQVGGVVVRRSNLSIETQVLTPSGTGSAFQLQRPAVVGEGETHWEIYGSADGGTFYGPIASVPIGTATYDDTADPATYSTVYDAEPLIGSNTPFPSVKYLYSTGTRLLGLGAWETAAGDSLVPKSGRLYIGPVLDSSGTQDDERISNTTTVQGWIDLARNAGGKDRGLSAVGNTIYAFQSRGIYGFVPTENAEVPYRRVVISSALGGVSHQSLVQAEDEAGRAALYFLDPEVGPYRIGANGLQWVGKDVKDVWDTVNHAASTVVAHGQYHKAKHQVIWWVATGTSNEPNTALVFDVSEGVVRQEGVRYGWSRYSGTFASARCSVMFSNTIGATMSRDLKPYVGTGSRLLKGDDQTMPTDDGTAYQAYVQSGSFDREPLFEDKAVMTSYLHATAAQDTLIEQTYIRGAGDETNRSAVVSLTALGVETDVLRKFEGATLTGAYAFQVRLGDAVATAKLWSLNRWYGVLEPREQR